MVIYDASSGFDFVTLKIDTDVVIYLPSNGKEIDIDFSEKPYHISYG